MTDYAELLRAWAAHMDGLSSGARALMRSSADEIDRLQAENERLRDLTQWQPIETALFDGTEVLLLTMYDVVVQAVWDDGWEMTGPNGRYLTDVYATHWMPLPEPPGEQSDD